MFAHCYLRLRDLVKTVWYCFCDKYQCLNDVTVLSLGKRTVWSRNGIAVSLLLVSHCLPPLQQQLDSLTVIRNFQKGWVPRAAALSVRTSAPQTRGFLSPLGGLVKLQLSAVWWFACAQVHVCMFNQHQPWWCRGCRQDLSRRNASPCPLWYFLSQTPAEFPRVLNHVKCILKGNGEVF